MAKRRTNRKGVLEWVTLTNMITAGTHTTATNELDTVDLDLNPDEVAEVKMIESYIDMEQTGSGADLRAMASLILSTDPSNSVNLFTSTDPYVATTIDNVEDEETFYVHWYHYELDFTTSGMASTRNMDKQTIVYPDNPPFLVGRNIGMNTGVFESVDGIGDIVYICRVWFKRRKGSPEEILNLIKH